MKNPRFAILTIIMTLACVEQIVLAIVLYDEDGNVTIINLGWLILWISAIFGWLPISTFKKRSSVPKGKNYISCLACFDGSKLRQKGQKKINQPRSMKDEA